MNLNLTLFGQAIALAIFVWFCMKYVWPPIIQALSERETRIADGLAAAEKGKHDLELAEQKAADLMREGRDKAQEYIAQAQKRADDIVDEAKQTAREEGERIKASARSDLDTELNQAREKLRAEVATLAIAGAEQILQREVDSSTHKQLLDKLSASL